MAAGHRPLPCKPRWLVAAVVLGALVPAAPASAMVVTCNKDPGLGPVNVSLGSGGSTSGRVQLIRSPGGTVVEVHDLTGGGNVTVPCGGGGSMAPADITQINVTEPIVQPAAVPGTRFEVSELNGRFEQSLDGNEIDINLDLGGDGLDTLEINPRQGVADVYRAGDIDAGVPVRIGVNVNNDDDDDIVLAPGSTLDSFTITTAYVGEINDDTVTFDGTGGAGQVSYAGPIATTRTTALAGGGNDTLVAGNGGGTLEGGDGNDTFTGGPGNDSFGLGLGNDSATDSSSSDNDLAYYSGVPGALSVDLGILGSQNTGGAGTDSLTQVEGVSGGTGADVLRGNALANVISDGDGIGSANDTLIGLGGNDALLAGAGDDLLVGGAGDDNLQDGDGVDTISYAQGSSGPVTINMGTYFANQDTLGAGVDILFDDGFENLISSPFSDTITGNALANTIDVRDGVSDTVTCLGGGDTVIADPQGLDVIGADCENMTFPPATPPPGSGGGDLTAPETTISKRPQDKSAKTKAKFKFTSSEPGSSFTCRLDKKQAKSCSSPQAYKKLKAKKHKFSVFATDAAGNADLTPAKDSFKVVAG